MTADLKALAKLRDPFPPNQIGKLPKGGTQLDFVGHGFITQRLLDVDPLWNWEPVALDGQGENSPFTEALLRHMTVPGADVHAVMRRVRGDVQRATAEQQIPWENSSLIDEMAFAETSATTSLSDSPPARPVSPSIRPEPFRTTITARSYAYVTGLDPNGDNFLALRTAPGTEGQRIATMGPDTLLQILEEGSLTDGKGRRVRFDRSIVILTSNNVRELGDALKRRCLHLHIGFPDHVREQRIVRARVDGISDTLLNQLVSFVQSVREADIKKRPSIAETVDWARTLLLLHSSSLDEQFVRDTLNVLLKHESDIAAISPQIPKMVREAIGTDSGGRTASGYPDIG